MSVERILATKGRDVLTVSPESSLHDAARLLAEKRIGALVVTSPDRQVRGILSERDIVRAVAADPASLNRQVSDFMTAHVITCGPHTSIPELMDEMTIGRFRHLPVVVDPSHATGKWGLVAPCAMAAIAAGADGLTIGTKYE